MCVNVDVFSLSKNENVRCVCAYVFFAAWVKGKDETFYATCTRLYWVCTYARLIYVRGKKKCIYFSLKLAFYVAISCPSR